MQEREFGTATIERATFLTRLFMEKRRVSAREATRLLGCPHRTTLYTISVMSRVLCLWYDHRTREWVYGYDDFDEEGLTYGR